tara:strand:- start:7258 stop:7638 length:381 start_codon:yes stop_codon:yes gene_type:complete
MAISQRKSKRKPSGGRYVSLSKKKLKDMGNLPTHTRVGKRASKVIRGLGGNEKIILTTEEQVNVLDPKTKKYSKLKIEEVLENPANRHFVRRNILTKGTIIKTSKGNARIISRPGQEGVINAILVK